MFAGKKSAQIREILISESAWEEMTCLFAPSLKFLYINIVKSVDEAWCSETTYKNLRSFNAMDGCSQMVGVEESRKVTGDVLITPELKSDFQGMFTPYLKPGR